MTIVTFSFIRDEIESFVDLTGASVALFGTGCYIDRPETVAYAYSVARRNVFDGLRRERYAELDSTPEQLYPSWMDENIYEGI